MSQTLENYFLSILTFKQEKWPNQTNKSTGACFKSSHTWISLVCMHGRTWISSTPLPFPIRYGYFYYLCKLVFAECVSLMHVPCIGTEINQANKDSKCNVTCLSVYICPPYLYKQMGVGMFCYFWFLQESWHLLSTFTLCYLIMPWICLMFDLILLKWLYIKVTLGTHRGFKLTLQRMPSLVTLQPSLPFSMPLSVLLCCSDLHVPCQRPLKIMTCHAVRSRQWLTVSWNVMMLSVPVYLSQHDITL